MTLPAEVETEEAEPATPEATIESLAREAGWKSKDEWKGPPPKDGFQEPADYLRSRASRADSLGKELAKFRKDTEKRIKRMEAQSEARRTREIAQLRTEYDQHIRQAVRAGDEDEFERLSKEKAELESLVDDLREDPEADEDEDSEAAAAKEQQAIERWQPASPGIQKAFWKDHLWALEDDADPDALRIVLDCVDNSGLSLPEALEKADQRLRRFYADKYVVDEPEETETALESDEDVPPPKKRVPVLATAARAATGPGLTTRLTAEQRAAGERFVKDGLFPNLTAYAKALEKEGDLP